MDLVGDPEHALETYAFLAGGGFCSVLGFLHVVADAAEDCYVLRCEAGLIAVDLRLCLAAVLWSITDEKGGRQGVSVVVSVL